MNHHPIILKALAFHEAAARVGVDPANIFVSHQLKGDGRMGVVIGLIAFPVGICDLTPEEFSVQWPAAVAWWNQDATPEVRQAHLDALNAEVGGGLPLVVGIQNAAGTIGQKHEDFMKQVPWAAVDEEMDKLQFVLLGEVESTHVYKHRTLDVELTLDFQVRVAETGTAGFMFDKLKIHGVDVLDDLTALGLPPPAMLQHALDRARGVDA